MIDDFIIRQIHSHSERILNAYGVRLTRGKGLCPFHDDTKPSFTAKFDTNGKMFWKCQACGVSGRDIISFVAKMEGKDERNDFREVVNIASKIAGITITDEVIKSNPTPRILTTTPPPPPVYLDMEKIKMASADVEQTNLFNYLATLWNRNDVKRIMDLYKCGLFREYKTPEGKRRGCGGKISNTANCITFPSIDLNGNVHAVKGVPYSIDGHRVRGSFPVDWNKAENATGCYFGIHLLSLFPALPIAVVESEKSAIIGMLEYPGFLWIATQGKTQTNVNKFADMMGREIHLFPDADAVKGWSDFCLTLQNVGHNVRIRTELIGQLPPESKLDIADIIIWCKQRNNGNK